MFVQVSSYTILSVWLPQFNLSKWRRAKQSEKDEAITEAEEEADYVHATEDNLNTSRESDQSKESDQSRESDGSFERPAPESALRSTESALGDDNTIPWRTAHMMWFSGLRGAVSYGLVRTFPDSENKATIVLTTMLLILLTTFLLGGTTEMVLNALNVPTGIDENQYLDSIEKRNLLPGFLLRFENNKLLAWAVRDDAKMDIVGKKTDAEEDADDPELTPYENIDVVQGDDPTHRISIVRTNRNGKIFDYGA